MMRNVIESDFWLSKMAAGGHFVNFFFFKVAYDVFVYDLQGSHRVWKTGKTGKKNNGQGKVREFYFGPKVREK